ncbi:hypothetical protein ACOMHN_059971 [Nucella lapillus]
MNSTLTSMTVDVTLLHNASSTSNMTSEEASMASTTEAPSQWGKYGAVEQYTQFWVALYMNRYCLTVISAVGLPGNFLSLVTILRMKPYSQPSLYVALLALTDNLCLVCKLLFIELTRYDIDLTDFGCQFLYFIGHMTSIYANWLLVMMTVERFLAIWFPLKVSSWCTRRRSVVGVCLMLLATMTLCSAYFVMTGQDYHEGNYYCTVYEEYQDMMNFVWYWVDGLMFALVPCILLTIFNTLIVVGIRRANSIQRQLTEDSTCRNKQAKGQAMEQLRQQRQITLMLLTISVVFIILILPNCIFFICKPYWKVERSDILRWANYKCVEQFAYFLADVTHAINFFVYFFSTKKFRGRVLSMVCCCRQWKRRIARTSHVGQSQLSDTGSIYITSTSHSGVIPLSLRNSEKY